MPPKKRKAADSDESDASTATKPKASKQKQPLTPIHPDMPTNTVLPTPLTVPPRAEDAQLRFATWNVAGIKACDKKGLKFYLEAEDPDIIVLTETKVQSDPKMAYIDNRYPHTAWGGDPQKGYAGVAVLSKLKPLYVINISSKHRTHFMLSRDVTYGLPTLEDPKSSHGRMVTFEFENTYFVGVCKQRFF